MVKSENFHSVGWSFFPPYILLGWEFPPLHGFTSTLADRFIFHQICRNPTSYEKSFHLNYYKSIPLFLKIFSPFVLWTWRFSSFEITTFLLLVCFRASSSCYVYTGFNQTKNLIRKTSPFYFCALQSTTLLTLLTT